MLLFWPIKIRFVLLKNLKSKFRPFSDGAKIFGACLLTNSAKIRSYGNLGHTVFVDHQKHYLINTSVSRKQ